MTPTDFQTKRNLGLCYKCDEYTIGHVCKNKSPNFILADEEESEEKEEGKSESEDDEVMEISVSALAGDTKHKTIRVPEFYKGGRFRS